MDINSEIISLFSQYPLLIDLQKPIVEASNSILESFLNGNKLLVCGNGGSAADSEHIVGELMKSFKFKRPLTNKFIESYKTINETEVPNWLEGALPAIALTAHTAFSTAYINDENAVGVFAQQVYGYGSEGDILLGISTSGNSANVVEAVKVAKAKDIKTIGLTGRNESKLSDLCDICIRVPSDSTPQIQELHLPIYHAICASIEYEIFHNRLKQN